MKKKILVLAGGVSPEHNISLQSAMNVVRHLDGSTYAIYPLLIDREGYWIIPEKPLSKAEQPEFEYSKFFLGSNSFKKLNLGTGLGETISIDPYVVFIMMHGPGGEDGKIQGMFEMAGIPFVGPDATACAAAMDKVITKLVIEQLRLATPDYLIVHNKDWKADRKEILKNIEHLLELPVFVKSPTLGSSYGMGIADAIDEVESKIDNLFKQNTRLIIEKYIDGMELTVPIFGNSTDGSARALPVIMIVPKKTRFFDLEAKYDNTITDEIVPAPIEENISRICQEEALRLYYALGCDGLSRIDLIWSDNKAYFLEVNPIPGFTSASLYPKSANADGMSYPKLLDKLIEFARASADIRKKQKF
jgi:D-alanine-D-alanine ligase